MASYRKERINDEVTRTIADALRSVKDPRVAERFITVTQSRVSGDLKYAKIFFSVMGDPDAAEIKEIKKGLQSAAGFLRRALATEINLRITPELSFEYDDSIEHGAHIEQLLKDAPMGEPDKTEDQQ